MQSYLTKKCGAHNPLQQRNLLFIPTLMLHFFFHFFLEAPSILLKNSSPCMHFPYDIVLVRCGSPTSLNAHMHAFQYNLWNPYLKHALLSMNKNICNSYKTNAVHIQWCIPNFSTVTTLKVENRCVHPHSTLTFQFPFTNNH